MMSFIIKNEKGYVGAMLVIAVAIIVGIMIVGITQKMDDLTRSYDKSRAFFDSEVAIEKFSVALKNAYDRANYLTDLRPDTGGDPTLGDYGCPGKLAVIGAGASIIKLCWEFGSSGNSLCTKRARDVGGPLDICIDQSNLQVRFKNSEEWEVVVDRKKRTNDEQWALIKAATLEFIKDFAIQPAQANLDAFDPGVPPVTSINSIDFNPALRSRPEAPDCTVAANNPFQCLKVSFCVKVGGGCGPEEFIRQTYLFSKPATTTQGW